MQTYPITEKEIAESDVFPDGVYAFTVTEAGEGLSQSSGLPMITIKLQIYDNTGRSRNVRDFLTSSQKALPRLKVKRFMQSVGLEDRIESGELTALDCIGRSGFVLIGKEKYGDKFYNRVQGPGPGYVLNIAGDVKKTDPKPTDEKIVPHHVPPPAGNPDEIPF